LLAQLLALAAAHLYQVPNLVGNSARSWWLEGDVQLSLASGALSLGVGLWSARQIARPAAFQALLLRALIWFGLTVCLFAVWGHYVDLLTLLIAPTQAFAWLRSGTLWRAWRSDVAFRRSG
jgi:hypothetical protein